jgi:hypothetical protein
MLFGRARKEIVGIVAAGAVTGLLVGAANKPSTVDDYPAHVRKAEEVGKNIKVLNGMPYGQMFPVMRFMAASLGVSCEHCHVSKGGGQLDLESDEKEAKRVARDMIKMTMVANKSTFEGKPVVSCFTCHRGQIAPQNVPGLPVPQLQPAAATPAASPSPSPALPTADVLFNKYSAAIGTEAAAGKIRSCLVKGSVANASGSSGTYEAGQVLPDKGFEIMTTQRGTFQRVLNDGRGWEKAVYGGNPMEDQQLEDANLGLPLSSTIRLRAHYIKAETSKTDQLRDRSAYLVVGTRADGKRERLYFDVENGLLLRRVSSATTPVGLIQVETDYDDYREVEGIKLPTTIRTLSVDSQNPSSTRKLESIELNVAIDDAKFGKPDIGR